MRRRQLVLRAGFLRSRRVVCRCNLLRRRLRTGSHVESDSEKATAGSGVLEFEECSSRN